MNALKSIDNPAVVCDGVGEAVRSPPYNGVSDGTGVLDTAKRLIMSDAADKVGDGVADGVVVFFGGSLL